MEKIVRCFWGLCIICVLSINTGCVHRVNETEHVLNTEMDKVIVCLQLEVLIEIVVCTQ